MLNTSDGSMQMELHTMSLILSQNHKSDLAYIYILIDPRTNQPFYVGRTVNPFTRLSGHIEHGRKYKVIDDGTKRSVIRSILNDGLEPIMRVIEVTTLAYQCEREFTWWQGFIERGYSISNIVRWRGNDPQPQSLNDLHATQEIADSLSRLRYKKDRYVIIRALEALDGNLPVGIAAVFKKYISEGE